MKKKLMILAATCLALSVFSGPSAADEGMWLFTDPPSKLLKDKYGFDVKDAWLEHVQKSCVKFGRSGSSSLVSSNGLVMTNHHVGFGQLYKLSTPERNLLEEGFYAATRDEELQCDDLEMKVLWSIEDVTDDVVSAGKSADTTAGADSAKRKRIAEIEKQAKERTGLTSDVVTLFHGARYHLYQYKRYTDIRLVMAPEGLAAHFGGDTDNFEYPRYCIDVSFFRIYENGKPLQPKHHLSWSTSGARDGELTFIVGHPARTERMFTLEHLKFLRDVKFPTILKRLWRREVQLLNFSARSKEQERMARSDLGGVRNSRKAFTGMLAGALDPNIWQAKQSAEWQLRLAVDANPEYASEWGDAWARVAQAQQKHAEIYERYSALAGRRTVIRSDLFAIARNIVRLADELPKPNGERLSEYSDASLESLYLRLYSPAPIHPKLEINQIESGLSYLAETFGADDLLVRSALAGQSPRARAASLVRHTKLADVDERKRLVEGGADAVRASDDPMIALAALLDPETRMLRKIYEDEVESVEHDAYARIAAAQFAIQGANTYPDATFTLRLAFGPVMGYTESGVEIPPFTELGGLYERHEARGGLDPFKLPERWLKAKSTLDLNTPYNFVSTADIIGGNSGSPVINRKGEVVGIVFDGNIQSLVWDIAYTDHEARAVSVDSRGIIEVLRNVYHADALANELVGR